MTARFLNLLWPLLTPRQLAGPPQVRAPSFPQSLPHLLDKYTPLRAFGRCNDVLAYPTYQASYAIPVRQYRVLPVGFLQCIPHGKPPCHLLTVRGVTPIRKGLSPSGMKLKFHRVNPLEIFHATHYCLTRKICIFNIFSELSVVCAHAHAGHTQSTYCRAGFDGMPTAGSRIAVPCPSDRNALRNPPRQHVPTVVFNFECCATEVTENQSIKKD
jgi:hypothetical protein